MNYEVSFAAAAKHDVISSSSTSLTSKNFPLNFASLRFFAFIYPVCHCVQRARCRSMFFVERKEGKRTRFKPLAQVRNLKVGRTRSAQCLFFCGEPRKREGKKTWQTFLSMDGVKGKNSSRNSRKTFLVQ